MSENPDIEKLDLASLDVAEEKRNELLRLFPEVRTEGGKIDFERLKSVLGEMVDVGRERYGMNWPGKAECMGTIQAPSMGTLLPMPEESVDWDTTENVIIEGDNLEVLKLLQKSYLGKVKMIYIDPPYNTGNDFIYPDDYSESLQTYLEYTGQVDAKGRKFGTNTDTDGRFHSKWLNMMYPRLYLARNLLADNGVIFISIDDVELATLRNLCNEVFGELNFIALIIWRKRSTPPNDKIIGANHDYILVFSRNIDSVRLHLRERTEQQIARYKNPDNHRKGPWAPGDLMANVKGGRYVASLHFPIRNPRTGQEHYPGDGGNWRFSRETIERLIENSEIFFGEDDQGRPKLKRFLCDIKDGVTWPTIWDFAPLNTHGSDEMRELLGNATVFESPKPAGLIERILALGTEANDLVLDFFAGSGSTAHATLSLNKKDGGNRKFILVQLPESVDPESAAGKAGFNTIADIAKERVRRVIKKLNDEENGQLNLNGDMAKQDRGFRSYKLAPSNFIPWDGTASNDADQLSKQLSLSIDHTRDDRSPEDLLYEILLKSWGEPALSLEVGEETIEGVRVFSIAEGAFLICLEEKVSLEFIRALAARKPDRVVMRESAFAGNDQLKANAVQTFKTAGVTSFKVV